MRYFLLLVLFAVSCQRREETTKPAASDSVIMVPMLSLDTPTHISKVEPAASYQQNYCDSIIQVNAMLTSLNKSLFNTNDTLAKQLFLYRYRVEKVRFYLNICLKNPTQDKFLKGWIKRAIN